MGFIKPTHDMLLDYVYGTLSADQRRQVEQAMKFNPETAEDVRFLQRLMQSTDHARRTLESGSHHKRHVEFIKMWNDELAEHDPLIDLEDQVGRLERRIARAIDLPIGRLHREIRAFQEQMASVRAHGLTTLSNEYAELAERLKSLEEIIASLRAIQQKTADLTKGMDYGMAAKMERTPESVSKAFARERAAQSFNAARMSELKSTSDLTKPKQRLIPTLLGIDLAWKRGNPSGLAFGVSTPDGLCVTEVMHKDLTPGWLQDYLLHLDTIEGIAIDAPLIVTNKSGQRKCETSISKRYSARGAGAHSMNNAILKENNYQTTEVSDALKLLNYEHLGSKHWQIECFPSPSLIELFGLQRAFKYKKGTTAERRQGQLQLAGLIKGLEFSELALHFARPEDKQRLSSEHILSLTGAEIKANEDCLDAIICLYIAALYKRDRSAGTVYGDTTSGYIWIPRV